MSDHRVVVPGGEIYYRSEGSGPPLVLIGGGPVIDDLGASPECLSVRFRLMSVDRPHRCQ